MLNINNDELKKLYFDKHTVVDIARLYNCCTCTIFKRVKNLGLSRERVDHIENIEGQRFGRLVALIFIRKDKFGKALWKVRCDCGKEKVINASGMKAGIVLSCGCYKKEKLSTGYEGLSGAYWRKIHKAALQRDFEFTITIKEAWELFLKQDKKCALSGVPLIMCTNNDQYYIQTASLDRIDSTKGYTLDNIQWVHKRVNFLKRDYPESELVFWCTKIANKLKDKFTDFDPNTLKEHRILHEDTQSIQT